VASALLLVAFGGGVGTTPSSAHAQSDELAAPSTCNGAGTSCSWMGYTWNTLDSDCGVGGGHLCNNVANETVDANGYLHLKIAKVGQTWHDAELWTQNNFGFGTFNIVVQADPSVFSYVGNTTSWNKDTVFSPFLYGPLNGIGKEGANEIDFAEFATWDSPALQNLDFTVYPAVGSGGDNGWDHVKRWIIPDNPTLVTVRTTWTPTSVTMTLYAGAVPLGETGTVIVANAYAPKNPSLKVPQTALPMVLNIYPSSLKTGFVAQEVIVQSFQYQAE